jgi:hypothetical protein
MKTQMYVKRNVWYFIYTITYKCGISNISIKVNLLKESVKCL